jgi:hypothetical protein
VDFYAAAMGLVVEVDGGVHRTGTRRGVSVFVLLISPVCLSMLLWMWTTPRSRSTPVSRMAPRL